MTERSHWRNRKEENETSTKRPRDATYGQPSQGASVWAGRETYRSARRSNECTSHDRHVQNINHSQYPMEGIMSAPEQAKEKIMPVTEQDKAVLNAIVEGFTLAIVEVCQTLEHQRSLPIMPDAFAVEWKNRAANLPNDPNGNLKRSILTNLANVVAAKPFTPIPFP